MAADEHQAFADIFPRNSDKERERFQQLEYAYISARYDAGYSISKSDLEQLSICVEHLMQLVQRICGEKIASL